VAIRFGITTMAAEPPDRFQELVRVAEAGCDYLWVCDSSLHARDVYAYLTLVALTSKRLSFGPNCIHPYTRHPAINFNAMATLHELSGGRAIVVVAAGDRPVMELGYRSAPVAVVREMIGVMRALDGGERADLDGPTFKLKNARVSFVPVSRLPIYVAASGPRMLQLGGEVADGVLFLSGVYPPCISYALEQIRAGALRAGRDPGMLDVGCTIYGSLRDDEQLARQECAPMAAWFPQTAPRYAEIAGVPAATIEGIRAAYAGGHFDDAREACRYVTDEMIHRFTVAGPAKVWVERIREVIAMGVTHINVFLLTRDKLAMARALTTSVFPRVRGG
jgi:5,10-methylenetetrahydromethanopterin reductase